LEIGPTEHAQALVECVDRLLSYDLAIFVSPNAVSHALPLILQRHGGWPATLAAATIGPGSAEALYAHGVPHVIAPSGRFDSESLLSLAALQAVQAQHILIFRGQGGRDVLAEGLRARGALVDYAECYRRTRPQGDANALAQAASRAQIDALILTSSEALRNLHCMLQDRDMRALLRVPLFVPHARIADNASRMGHIRVHLTEPGDAGLWSALQAFELQFDSATQIKNYE
jgi:uroporphyrinogen-III synthase